MRNRITPLAAAAVGLAAACKPSPQTVSHAPIQLGMVLPGGVTSLSQLPIDSLQVTVADQHGKALAQVSAKPTAASIALAAGQAFQSYCTTDTGTWNPATQQGKDPCAGVPITVSVEGLKGGKVAYWGSSCPLVPPPQNHPPLVAGLFFGKAGTFNATAAGMVVARNHFAAVRLQDGRVLVVGGLDPSGALITQHTLELYDPNTGGFSSAGLPELAQPRFDHTATLLSNGQVLIAGGYTSGTSSSGAGATSVVELFDPASGTVQTLQKLDTPRAQQTATLLPGVGSDDLVMLVGGVDNNKAALASASLYDPVSQTSASIPLASSASAPGAQQRIGSVAVPIGNTGNVLVACGENTFPDGQLYSAGGFQLTQGQMRDSRVHCRARYLASENKVYLFGGVTQDSGSQSSTLVEAYDPLANQFLNAGSLLQARNDFALAPLPGDKVLVLGGAFYQGGQATGPAATAEIFDPTLGSSAATADPMLSARQNLRATRLCDGTVLVMGGTTADSAGPSAEIFIPQPR